MTRRELLAAPALLAAAAQRPLLAYIGTYSSPEGPEGSHGRGEGIYLFEMDPGSGALKQRELFRSAVNPAWLELDASGTHLYSANETRSGSVSAYVVDRSTGRLALLNTQGSGGAGPCHLSIHPSGKYVLVAN